MSVDHQRLNLTDRKGYLGLLAQHLSDVDSSQRCIVSKINGNCQPFHSILETIGGKVHVEAHPVEVLAEGLPVALLSASPVASKLKKVYLSGYAHD